MEEIKVRCNKCSSVTGTGFYSDAKSFESSTFIGNKCSCSHCGVMITWNKKDVVNNKFKKV